MTAIADRLGKPVDEALRDLYIERGWSLPEIGAEWGVGVPTLSRWMKELGIPTRIFGTRRSREERAMASRSA